MSTSGGGGRRRAADVVGVLAVLLAVIGAVALVVGLRAQDPAPPQVPAAVDASSDASSASPDPSPSGRRVQEAVGKGSGKQSGGDREDASPAEPAVEELDYSPPVNLRIPSIGVDSDLVDLGLDDAGAMETPVPVEQAGWFAPSPPPGVPGSSILVGHVTWNQAPTVFFRLGELRPGDRVEVRREDGVRTVFEVTRLGTFPKDGFPTAQVFDHPHQSELRLITCGGRYDAVNHRYLSNVIVWARIVDVVGA